ncbi:MAG: D-alanine--D-alanine ligase [Armatimonadetes bacterium]|nr:D-alanine--D-alanine ligase [Armatimonadota bacterium]
MPERLRVGVIFGGRSGEHEVSLASACWLVGADAWPRLRREARLALGPGEEDGDVPRGTLDVAAARASSLVPAADGAFETTNAGWLQQLDVILPILHGTYGEDGVVQGLLELADVPYVGSGVAGSAVAMDKILAKHVLAAVGVPQAGFLGLTRSRWEAEPDAVRADVAALGYPCFVKPANLGSSVGIRKVHHPAELDAALAEAARFDRRIIVEQGLQDVREIEVSVLGNDEPIASVPGEIVPCNEFYDYEAKYLDGRSEAIIPADLPPAVTAEVQQIALTAYRALDLAGMARIDFFVARGDHRVYLNEGNTIPGFTPISMYPKLWAASGLPYPDLLARLIALALERHQDRSRNATSI